MKELQTLLERAEALYASVSPDRNGDDVEGIAISVIGKVLADLTPESRAAVLEHFSKRYPPLERAIITSLVRDFALSYQDLSNRFEEMEKTA